MQFDYFAHKASSYEQNESRVDNVRNIANAMLNAVNFDKTMHIMDFGSGTGLLLEQISDCVSKITAIDISASMNRQLNEKRGRLACELEIIEVDLEKFIVEQKFDGIVSSMTLHHIENVSALFEKLYSMLNDGGFVAISDLDTEDGTFHTEDTGVFHNGFCRNEILKLASKAGFRDINIASASIVRKPQGDYSVFLLTALR